MLLHVLLATAHATGGMGITGEMAMEPMRPAWDRKAVPVNFICGGIQIRIADDNKRFGMDIGGCGAGWGHATDVHLGFGPGRQTRGRVYIYGDLDFGLSVYAIEGPRRNSWAAVTAMVRPKVGVGVVLNDAMAMEFGPAIQTGIPFLQFVNNETPNGFHYGHITFGGTFYIGEFTR